MYFTSETDLANILTPAEDNYMYFVSLYVVVKFCKRGQFCTHIKQDVRWIDKKI